MFIARLSAGLLAVLLIACTPGHACTVFFAFDGKLALAGSNEDWADPNTQVCFVPATKDTYGIVYFGFGCGEYRSGFCSSAGERFRSVRGTGPVRVPARRLSDDAYSN